MFKTDLIERSFEIQYDERIRSHATNIQSRFSWADREMVHRKFYFALRYAAESFDPSFGMSLAEYEDLCLMNCRHRILRECAAEAAKRGVTCALDANVAGDDGRGTYGDLLVDSRNTERRQRQVLALREFFAGLTGNDWTVCVAVLAGYNRSEIARHLGVPRTSFDRIYGPVLGKMKEVANV